MLAAPPLHSQLSSTGAWLSFTLRFSLLPVLVLVPWGAVQAILGSIIDRAARQLAKPAKASSASRLRVDSLRAALWALLSAPYVLWVCQQMFLGPRAQRLPGRQLWTFALFLVGLLAIRQAVLAAWALERMARGRMSRALGAAAIALFLALSLGAADRTVLPRLYPFFHLSLEISEAALALLAVALLMSGLDWQTRPTTPGRSAGCLLFVTLIAVASFSSLLRIHRATVLRGLVIERTMLASQIMRPYAAWKARRAGGSKVPAPNDATPQFEVPPPSYTGPRLAGRDVFLITIDALRQDRLAPSTMPAMSALAQRGITFNRAYTQVPHTSFAVATLLTGKPVYALLELGQDAASHETLPLVLRRFRYKTAAFYPPAVFFIERERLKRLEESAYGFEYVKYEYMAAPGRTDQVITFLETEKPAHAFVWVHYFEPHEPYDPHELPGKSTTPQSSDRERYDGEVRFVDAQVKRLVDYIERTRPGALIVLAADHGEEFGEHGGRYHGTTLYEEQEHVPLFFTELSKTPLLKPRSLAQPVGLIDVGPTLLGLLDIEKSARMRGHDLSPWLLSGATELPLYPIHAEIGRQKMVVVGDRKLICDLGTDTCQSFDLKSDPAEKHNIIDSAPDEARKLRAKLDSYLGESRRYETSSTRGAAAEAAVLTRARLGDRAALPQLLALLAKRDADPQERRQALALFASLVAGAQTKNDVDPLRTEPSLFAESTQTLLRELSAQAKDEPDMSAERQKRWAAVALVRLFGDKLAPGDAASREVVTLISDDKSEARQRLSGALALSQLGSCAPGSRGQDDAIDCVALWLQALPPIMELEDPDAARPLLEILGRSRDHRALAPLSAQLERVRTRADVVSAIGALGDRAALPALAKLLGEDPYVNVRIAAATAIAGLGGLAAHSLLLQAQTSEREQSVRSAIGALLGPPANPPSKSPPARHR